MDLNNRRTCKHATKPRALGLFGHSGYQWNNMAWLVESSWRPHPPTPPHKIYKPSMGPKVVSNRPKTKMFLNHLCPFPSISWICLTCDLSPIDLNIDRGHLLIKCYLPTKFKASGAKCSWDISYTRCERPTWLLTLTFDLMTWI